jgi:hypothetical protein
MMQTNQMKAQAAMQDAQTRSHAAEMKGEADLMKAKIEMIKAQNDLALAEQELRSKAADRTSRERIQLVDLAQNLSVHPASAGLVSPLIEPAMQDIDRQEEIGMQGLQQPRSLGGE